MHKVIIADDHIPVLDYLSSSIPWNDLGLQLAKLCTDGEEALEACLLHQADILITDIGMPVMDGLELIDNVMQTNPKLKTIILSCHEDFQFAQRAVKLNVRDYILKENLQIEQMIDILRTMSQVLCEEQAMEKVHLKLRDVIKQNRSAIRTSFLRNLLELPVTDEVDWVEKAEAVGIHARRGIKFMPVLVIAERPAELEKRFGGPHLMQYILDNALNEMICTKDSVLMVYEESRFILLVPFHQTLKRNIHDEIKQELRLTQQAMHRIMRVGISCIIGGLCEDLHALKKQIHRLLDCSTFRFYAGERITAKLEPVAVSGDDIFIHYSEALQDFRTSLLNHSETDMDAAVLKWIKHIEKHRYSTDIVRSWVLKIATELELKYTVMQHFVTKFNAELLHHSIFSIYTLDHLKEWLTAFLSQKMTTIKAMRNPNLRKEISEAKRYVLKHIGEKISMEEVATRVRLNPTHFSRMFKNETGETFVKFMTREKMERAIELLDQSDLTIEQIAEHLGYENVTYFFKLFRNHSGMTPQDYRRRI
ncbi:helix-turn-helix domain-containing protein [Paenibacillus periandrae]|uniref:helix-turn-helix domain-containing protein n=1 Tax=Paenibacillus periandrae TaxID=1761741 RepID=UPI001F0930D5|nr:helix-turn-helix domain-containing protein [Paenibacillus periandrae]